MLFVVGFYRGINKIDAATELLEGFIKITRDIEQSAHCYLALGQMATDEQRQEDALKHFTLALELAPKKRKVRYVLQNNIAYCLNTLSRFEEGEKHCRQAIEIDWTRASGYRNLGISLNGQGNVSVPLGLWPKQSVQTRPTIAPRLFWKNLSPCIQSSRFSVPGSLRPWRPISKPILIFC